jgi:S-adenosylmethionine:tRNA ribosyltransferase-isomerase
MFVVSASFPSGALPLLPTMTILKNKYFNYHLPPELIAQYPTARRSDARMLVLRRETGEIIDASFRQLPDYLTPGDLLVLNNSRVLPARLFGFRLGTKAKPIGRRNLARPEYLSTPIEVLLTRRLNEGTWEALVRPGRKIRVGERIVFVESSTRSVARTRAGKETGKAELEAEVIGRGEYGMRTLRFIDGAPLMKQLERIGHIPLPPYIRRPAEETDRNRYQTVYAKQSGSIAAPTAGLHFTRPMLSRLASSGVERAEITLHVGLGTFQPIHAEQIEQHYLHPEQFQITEAAAGKLQQALRCQRRVIAVGTTSVRTLEHVAAENQGMLCAGEGETQLFILPGFPFRVVRGLLTNFHLPRTSLLMLIAAFGGRELMLAAYQHAVRERYRFYSYGDCMLIL